MSNMKFWHSHSTNFTPILLQLGAEFGYNCGNLTTILENWHPQPNPNPILGAKITQNCGYPHLGPIHNLFTLKKAMIALLQTNIVNFINAYKSCHWKQCVQHLSIVICNVWRPKISQLWLNFAILFLSKYFYTIFF